MKSLKHTFFHHLAMVVYSEIINIIWLTVGIVLVATGGVIYEVAYKSFYKIAIGAPIFLIGASVGFFKIYEIIQTLLDIKRIKTICIFCTK